MKNKIFINFIVLIFIIGFIIPINSVQAVEPSKVINKAANTSMNTTKTINNSNRYENTSSNTQTNVNTNANKNSNANLSNLGIQTYDFTGFKPDITMYTTTVPNEVTEVEVYAVPQSNATYVISGNTNLSVGSNRVTIKVTSADKTNTKEYYINVEREDKTAQEVNQEEKLELISIKIDDSSIKLEPEFKSDIYQYTVKFKEDIDKIPLSAIANKEGARIEIKGNENLKDGRNTIEIIVTRGFEEVKYKITVRKNMKDDIIEESSANNYLSQEHIQVRLVYSWCSFNYLFVNFFNFNY